MKPKGKLYNLGLMVVAPLAFAGYTGYKLSNRQTKRKELKDQVVVITGASTGIGKAYATAFAAAGAKLVLAARSTDKLEALAEDIKGKYKTDVLVVTTDVSKEEDALNLIDTALEKFNHIDIMINNAGIAAYGYFHNNNTDDLKKLMDVNYWGAVYCTHAVLASMIRRGKGKIVNVSSFVGKRGVPVMAGYAASKFALGGFSESLRVEVKRYGIDVLVVYPTATRTELVNNVPDKTNLKFGSNVGMSAERVAVETVNAILDNKRELIIGIGENISLAINKTFPSLVDKVMAFVPRFMIKS